MVSPAEQLHQEWAQFIQPGDLGIKYLEFSFLPSLSCGSLLKLFSAIRAVYTLYVRHYRQPKASWLIAHRHIFFLIFFSCDSQDSTCCSCHCLSSLYPTNSLSVSLCAQEQTGFLCLLFSVLPSSWKYKSSSRTGETSCTVLSRPSASLSGFRLCLKTGRCLWIWGYRADILNEAQEREQEESTEGHALKGILLMSPKFSC